MPRLFAPILAASLVTGCATGLEPSRSGFLGDYSALRPDEAEPGLLTWRHPDVDWSDYGVVVVDPVDVRSASLDVREGRALADGLHQALSGAMAADRRLQRQAGHGVLRVRAAVTEVVRPNRALNLVTGLLAAPVSRGAAAAEAEILDGETGQPLAALSWAGDGRISEFTGFYQRDGHARAALRRFAAEVAALAKTEPQSGRQQRRQP